MGGTFDPIHTGHLCPAEAALEAFELERVVFIPSGRPPHKRECGIEDAEHRYAMVLLATCANPRFEVSRAELERRGLSFTVDTVGGLAQIFPEAEFYFITGADALVEIFTWRDWMSLFGLCHFIAVPRPGYDLAEFFSQVDGCGAEVARTVRSRVHIMPAPLLEISSTCIRACLASGRPVRYLVPEPVYAYIVKHKLYLGD